MKAKLLLLLTLSLSLVAHAQTLRSTRRTRAAVAATSTERPADVGTPRATQTLPIRRVILYSNGVAYIERRGTVTGHAEIDLSFKQSQVDDVLKSMVVLDLGRGRIGAVSYNSSAPPSARMADIPFSIASATDGQQGGGLAGVLGQLQGARVAVTTTAGRTATGSILTVEERHTQSDDSKTTKTTHALVIASDAGDLSSFDLSEVRAVKLLDEGARRDVGEFAQASASARRRDAKTITVTSDGEGTREMVVSYTVAAPIWKTTYRVVLDEEGKPFFQGWAIVDNVSEEDWTNVRLSLISGTPVSFIQPIQKPFYRYRPVVPIPEDLRLSPQVYEPNTGEGASNTVTGVVKDPQGAVVAGATVIVKNEATGQTFTATTDGEGAFRSQMLAAGNYTVTVESPGFKRFVMTGVRVGPVRPAHVSATLSVGGVSETVTITGGGEEVVDGDRPINGARRGVNNFALLAPGVAKKQSGKDEEESVGEALTSGESGVEADTEAGEVGDLFEYQIAHPVTVRRDRSALIPIVQTRMEGERVSIFRESEGRSRPMSGLLLKNTSTLTLEGGAVTVIDGDAYAGEALMERLKPSEQRLVSFALDLGTLVTVRPNKGDDDDDNDAEASPVFFVRIQNGTLTANYYNREKKTYTLTNQTDHPRTVFVEHPVRDDWQLDDKETPTPESKTKSFYRFRVELKAHETATLNVVEREEGAHTYALSNVTPDQIQLFVTERYIDEPTHAALQNILDLKARLAAAQARVAAADKEIAEIAADQKRLRDNIESLTKTDEARQLIARYVSKADQQETRLEQLAKEKQAATDEAARLQAQLDAAIRTLALERNLAGART
jgi:hypothetical protein